MNALPFLEITSALTAVLVGAPVVSPGQDATKPHINSTEDDVPTIRVPPPLDDGFVRAELGRLGGQMIKRGQLLPKRELLKRRPTAPRTLPRPSVAEVDEAVHEHAQLPASAWRTSWQARRARLTK